MEGELFQHGSESGFYEIDAARLHAYGKLRLLRDADDLPWDVVVILRRSEVDDLLDFGCEEIKHTDYRSLIARKDLRS